MNNVRKQCQDTRHEGQRRSTQTPNTPHLVIIKLAPRAQRKLPTNNHYTVDAAPEDVDTTSLKPSASTTQRPSPSQLGVQATTYTGAPKIGFPFSMNGFSFPPSSSFSTQCFNHVNDCRLKVSFHPFAWPPFPSTFLNTHNYCIPQTLPMTEQQA